MKRQSGLNAELELKRKEELFSRLLYAKASYKETEKLFKELTDAGVKRIVNRCLYCVSVILIFCEK